jgi:hypothetical protein
VTIVTGAFLITFGSVALCLALAVGLGSRRGIELMWERYLHGEQPDGESDAARPGVKDGDD